MDSKAIETFGIIAVQESVMFTDTLSPFIADNDKEPSWDGAVFIYHSKEKRNDNLMGRVPVQVKGKLNKNLSAEEISYPVEVAHLKIYFRDGGVIYFVVLIDKDHPTTRRKIYYASLTPVRLNHYLKDVTTQKTKSIKLKVFPEDNNKKTAIFADFWHHSKTQTGFTEQGFIPFEEIQQNQALYHLTIPIHDHIPSETIPPISDLLKHDLYLYIKPEGINKLIPTDLLIATLDVSETADIPITVNRRRFYDSFKRTFSPGKLTIQIGESIKMYFEENSSTIKFNTTFTSKLRERVKDLEFFIESIKNGHFKVGDTITPLTTINPPIDTEPYEQLLANDCRIVQMLDILNVKEDLDTAKLTSDAKKDIERLVSIFVDNQDISDLNVKTPSIINLKLDDIYLKLIIFKKDNGKYTIHDFFNSPVRASYKDQEKRTRKLPLYSVLCKDDFMKISNIDYHNIVSTYQKLSETDSNIYEWANKIMLEMLLAHDEKPNIRLFQVIKDIAQWLISEDKNVNCKNIRIINYLQIIKRERELNLEEKKQLFEIAENTSSRQEKIGANLLLDNHLSAEYNFDKLDETEQKMFQAFPIFKFAKQS